MSGLESFLSIVLIILIFIVIGLIIVFIMLKKKENESNNLNEKEVVESETIEKTEPTTKGSTKIATEYSKKSIFDFMEFDTVKDNMIIQKNGKKFLMAIECKGVNYDLMSEIEKSATEQGFSAFLNSLREPIQIYIQTRTINLEKNIETYKERVNKLREGIELKEFKLKEYENRPNVNEKIIKDKRFELLREKNLYSYGVDIVTDTKRMSLNKNVLKKKYYVILNYYYEQTDAGDLGVISSEEMREVAFSNLYTKATSMVRVLSGIGVIGRVLNSFELVELLYNAYNRDDSEVFSVEKALEAGYDEVYIDAENVIDKKILALNNEAPRLAKEAAQKAIDQVLDERSQELRDIENNIDDIVAELAKQMIQEESSIRQDVKDEAKEKINKGRKQKEKEVEETNGKQNAKESIKKRRAD